MGYQARYVSSSPSSLRVTDGLEAIAVALPTIYVTGAIYPPRPIAILFPRSTPPAPKKESRAGKHVMDAVEVELQGLDVVAQMRNRDGWYESREFSSPSGHQAVD